MFVLNKVLPFRKNRIVFSSFSGRQFSDSPRVIYEAIKNSSLYREVECVWAFRSPEDFSVVSDKKVAINSLRFFAILATSKFWIANSSIERMVPYKPNGVCYINTWHGCPWKIIGDREPRIDLLMKHWYRNVEFDILTSSGFKDKLVFQSVFPSTDPQNIYPLGLPRNDEILKFLRSNDDEKKRIKDAVKQKLKLDKDKKVLLYAPTFRDNGEESSSYLKFEKSEWSGISSEFQILSRLHYNLSDAGLQSDLAVDVSDYPNLNELFFISDLVITDYSSVMFDFALMKKPILLYTRDFEEYSRVRGLYCSRNDLGLPYMDTESDLIEAIGNIAQYDFNRLKTFDERFNGHEFGATKLIVKKIEKLVNND